MLTKFNIRVYGLLIEDGQILLTDEMAFGRAITKFPGGGLELGEGSLECLVREFMEESGMQVRATEHFYTTEFFQASAFNPSDQIISIYYRVKRIGPLHPEHILPVENNVKLLSLRWVLLSELKEESVTLPIDKVVVAKLVAVSKNEHNQ
jgi:8-oxo-dGTP pyrophosphatase MutT (NUDIX family)